MAVDTFTGITLMLLSEPIAMRTAPGLQVDPLNDTQTGGAIMWFWGDAIMALIMVALVITWLRTSGQSTRDRDSWLEHARAATLRDRTGDASGGDIDEDQARLAAYNEWLANLARHDQRQ